MPDRKLVRLNKAGVASYTYDSPDGTWEIQQWGYPPDKAPYWYRFGHAWHLWSPLDNVRIKPEESFTTLTKAREWLTDKYMKEGWQ